VLARVLEPVKLMKVLLVHPLNPGQSLSHASRLLQNSQ